MKTADISMPIPANQIKTLRPRGNEKAPMSGYATNQGLNNNAKIASTLDASGLGPDVAARLDFYKSERSKARRANTEMELDAPSTDNNQKRFAFQQAGREKLNL